MAPFGQVSLRFVGSYCGRCCGVRLDFGRRLLVQFRGSAITFDAALLPYLGALEMDRVPPASR